MHLQFQASATKMGTVGNSCQIKLILKYVDNENHSNLIHSTTEVNLIQKYRLINLNRTLYLSRKTAGYDEVP